MGVNIVLLASEIVKRVHQSPDSAANLEILVVGLIRAEQERDLEAQRNEAKQAYQDCEIVRQKAIEEANAFLKDFARDFAPK